MRNVQYLALFLVLALPLTAQKQPLTYFLPEINYDKEIPTPEQFFGFQIGEWHLNHDQQSAYLRKLAELSPRIRLEEHGRTYEQRPLLHLIITSEKNQENLDEIKRKHREWMDPTLNEEDKAGLDLRELPVVIYQGYSIHGNEPSGGNAAPLVAYYLAAGKGREVERLLEETVIIFDPLFNPDGFTRFSTWANMHKNYNLTSDPQDREYDEAWPGGRTNHYWFDLNRDWLPVQHPESQGRIALFHEWKPNILTDHHEMGSNSTFFFMPGEPTRIHPLTPARNQELTARIADFHAETLDDIGSLYFSREGYDDYYYGKGSTYPDVNGCVGILFEQASSRGHLQKTDNGLLSFPFTIRNQVRTALSTYKAGIELREELLNFQRDFYRNAMEEAMADNRKAFVFAAPEDPARVDHFVEIMRRHQIDVHRLGAGLELDGKRFLANEAFIIPLEQPQYRLIRSIFEPITAFEDSLFYDISAFTLPLAFNLEYAEVSKRDFQPTLMGAAVNGLRPVREVIGPDYSEYAYLMEWNHYYAPKALNFLMSKGLRTKVAHEPFQMKGRTFQRGTILIPVQNQDKTAEEIFQLMEQAHRMSGVRIWDVDSGYTPEGVDLGSRSFSTLEQPRILLLIGEGVSSYDAGETWHLLDQRYQMVATKVPTGNFSRADLSRYNVLIMVDGNYNSLRGSVEALQDWVRAGGTIVAMKRAAAWLQSNGIGYMDVRRSDSRFPVEGRRPYAMADRDNGGNVLGGAIFENVLDLTHPLAYGYTREHLPVFRRGTLFFEPGKNPYGTPALYTQDPLLSGYINDANSQLIRNSAGIVVSGSGSGRVIFLADNPNFRAFWFGTNKLFANALFFGNTISGATLETAPPRR